MAESVICPVAEAQALFRIYIKGGIVKAHICES